MRLNHIYITKEGEPMANPETEYPTEPIEDNDGELILNDACPNCGATYDEIDAEYQICHLCKFDSSHEAELQRYHSGLLPFEDKKDALDFIPWEYHGYNGTILSQHWNTLIPVELEVEVCQIACQSPCDSYNDTGHCKNPKIFLRIKP